MRRFCELPIIRTTNRLNINSCKNTCRQTQTDVLALLPRLALDGDASILSSSESSSIDGIRSRIKIFLNGNGADLMLGPGETAVRAEENRPTSETRSTRGIEYSHLSTGSLCRCSDDCVSVICARVALNLTQHSRVRRHMHALRAAPSSAARQSVRRKPGRCIIARSV